MFMGYCDPQWQGKVEFHEFVPVQEYMTKMKSLELDVVLIPLEDNLFNRCKSHIKLLEFSTIGVPCITTEISPYRENPNYKIPTSNKSWKHFKEALECNLLKHIISGCISGHYCPIKIYKSSLKYLNFS